VTGGVHSGFWFKKPEGKIPIRRSRRRWIYNIKMDVEEVGWGPGMD
jgi:hypothetical protein